MSDETKTNKAVTLTPLQATVVMIRRGHAELLPWLRELLRRQPAVWQHCGNLGQQAERAWVELIGGGDDLLKESTILFAAEMKESLVGHNASRLEKLAAERVAAHWLETEYLKIWRAQHPEANGTKVGELYRKRSEEADRGYERALKSLAEIKRLIPKTIEVTVLQKSVGGPSPSPIVGGKINGDQPEADNPRATRFNSVNRIVGKLNGHNERLGKLLEPTPAK